MALDFKPYLLLALHELDLFSVPGVGTFVRRREKARFDPTTQELHPPIESVELKRGDEAAAAFVRFLVQKTGKPQSEAETLARDIGLTVVQYIQSLVDVELEGFGTLKKGPYNLPIFEPVDLAQSVAAPLLKAVVLPEAPPAAPAPTPEPAAKAPEKRSLASPKGKTPTKGGAKPAKKAAPQPVSPGAKRMRMVMFILVGLSALGTVAITQWDTFFGSDAAASKAPVRDAPAASPPTDTTKTQPVQRKTPSSFPGAN
ncbi:MAG: hypothetical protein SFY70_05970 [Bacteroidia bacterium]|nr:hypothetical protein [Bacteroidia bacterium]